MKINDIGKQVTAKSINESLAARFGKKIDLERFTNEQLEDARNKLRTQLHAVETMESFDSVHNEAYQKTKLFLDVLNAEISERVDDSKVDAKKKKKPANESYLQESEEDKAELVMAAKQMVERLTGWMEDVAEMQTEAMLDLSDSIRNELGQESADSFINTVKPGLESLYATMEETRKSLTSGVGLLTGEQDAASLGGEMPPIDGGDELAGGDVGADMTGVDDIDSELSAEPDDMGTDVEPPVGGRMRRESIERKKVSKIPTAKINAKESFDPMRLVAILSKKK